MPDDSAEKQFDRLRPDLVDAPEKIPDFLDRFVRDVVRCPTHESASLRLEKDEKNFQITGWVPYTATLEALRNLWSRTPFSSWAVNAAVLPTIQADIGSSLFAVSAATLEGKGSPDPAAPVVHVWESGSPIRPLHRQNGFVLCQSETGYLGWVAERELNVRDVPMGKREEGVPRIDPARLEEVALPFLGTSYVWGGSGFSGIDCSGFSQLVYKELGFSLPRDATQQMLGGRLVGAHEHRAPLEPGDLLFFTLEDGRIGHVAVSLGGWRAIHAERPEVCLFSLKPEQTDFNPVRSGHFAFAKRILL